MPTMTPEDTIEVLEFIRFCQEEHQALNPFKQSKSTGNSPTHFFSRRHCESEDNI